MSGAALLHLPGGLPPHGFGVPIAQIRDREAAVLAMYAFNSLYEATEDKKWLACAEHAAVFFASNVYTFDFNVWGNQKYNIYRDLVGTSGLSIIHSGTPDGVHVPGLHPADRPVSLYHPRGF